MVKIRLHRENLATPNYSQSFPKGTQCWSCQSFGDLLICNIDLYYQLHGRSFQTNRTTNYRRLQAARPVELPLPVNGKKPAKKTKPGLPHEPGGGTGVASDGRRRRLSLSLINLRRFRRGSALGRGGDTRRAWPAPGRKIP